MWAARCGHEAVVDALLRVSANPLARDRKGESASEQALALGESIIAEKIEAAIGPWRAQREAEELNAALAAAPAEASGQEADAAAPPAPKRRALRL